MVALRKTLALLSLLALAVVGSSVAKAQNAPLLGLVACTATAVPPVVRAEGIAELVGDIVLTCVGTPGANQTPSLYLKTNVSVSLNVNITNNIDFGEGSDVSDAVLIINENNCTQPSALTSETVCMSVSSSMSPRTMDTMAMATFPARSATARSW